MATRPGRPAEIGALRTQSLLVSALIQRSGMLAEKLTCKLCTRLHSKLLIHLPQVVVHRCRADKQLGGDFAVGAALDDESSDPCLLGSHDPARLHVALPGPVTYCFQ